MPTKDQIIHDLAVAYATAEYKESRDYLRMRGSINDMPFEERAKGFDPPRLSTGETSEQSCMIKMFYNFYAMAIETLNDQDGLSDD